MAVYLQHGQGFGIIRKRGESMKSFSESNPIAVTVYFLSVTIIAMFSMNPMMLAISIVGSLICYSAINGTGHSGFHLISLGIFFATAMINPLVSHNGVTVLFVMNDNPVTLEALLYGISAAVMIVSVMYWFGIYSYIMTSDKLLYIFGALSPKLALMLSMSLRYVPLLSRQAKKVNSAQKAMGLYKEDNLWDSFRGGIRVFSVMVTWALENGIVTADSMTARGYGAARRSQYRLYRFHSGDILLITASAVLFAVTIYGTFNMSFEFYPEIKYTSLGVRELSGLCAYGALVFLPAIIEAKEEIKWKYLQSKI